jgi:hypothetical protein
MQEDLAVLQMQMPGGLVIIGIATDSVESMEHGMLF